MCCQISNYFDLLVQHRSCSSATAKISFSWKVRKVKTLVKRKNVFLRTKTNTNFTLKCCPNCSPPTSSSSSPPSSRPSRPIKIVPVIVVVLSRNPERHPGSDADARKDWFDRSGRRIAGPTAQDGHQGSAEVQHVQFVVLRRAKARFVVRSPSEEVVHEMLEIHHVR